MSLIGSGVCCHFIIKAKALAVEIGPKMTSAFARIVSERERSLQEGHTCFVVEILFKTRKIFADLFWSSSPVLVFALWTLTTFVEVDYYRLMISDVVQSKIAGLLRSLENNDRDPGNLKFRFQYAKMALNSCLF